MLVSWTSLILFWKLISLAHWVVFLLFLSYSFFPPLCWICGLLLFFSHLVLPSCCFPKTVVLTVKVAHHTHPGSPISLWDFNAVIDAQIPWPLPLLLPTVCPVHGNTFSLPLFLGGRGADSKFCSLPSLCHPYCKHLLSSREAAAVLHFLLRGQAFFLQLAAVCCVCFHLLEDAVTGRITGESSAAVLRAMLWLWQVLLGALLAKDTSIFFTSTELKVLNDCDMLVVADVWLASTPGHLGSASKQVE